MAFNIIHTGFYLVAIVGLQHKCDAAEYHNATSAMEAIVHNCFPDDIEFNESCVAEGCPDLKNVSLCPFELEINKLRDITEIINKCMRGPICGIVSDPRPIQTMVVSTEEILTGVEIDGNCTFIPGSSTMSNISNIQLDTSTNPNQQHLLQITLLIPHIRSHGHLEVDLHMVTGFGTTVIAKLKDTIFDIETQFISMASINQTGSSFDVKMMNPFVKARTLICGMDMPYLETLFAARTQKIHENSSLAKAIATYLRKLYASALNVVSNNCRSLNVTV